LLNVIASGRLGVRGSPTGLRILLPVLVSQSVSRPIIPRISQCVGHVA